MGQVEGVSLPNFESLLWEFLQGKVVGSSDAGPVTLKWLIPWFYSTNRIEKTKIALSLCFFQCGLLHSNKLS